MHLIGDSTCAPYDSTVVTKGWGQKLGEFLAPGATVDNRAIGGYSAKAYLDGTMFAGTIWPGILDSIRPGDWVLINLGVNDAAIEHPERYSTPAEFEQRLGTMVSDIRSRSGQAIFVTQVPTRSFYPSGQLGNSRGYSDAMIEAAKANSVEYLDLNTDLAARYQALGPEGCKVYGYKLADGVTWDTIHFNDWGARQVAELVATEIKASDSTGLAGSIVPEPGIVLLAAGVMVCTLGVRPKQRATSL